MTPTTDDETPLDPAAMLALAEKQQREVERQMGAGVPWILLAWGIAWGVGFTLLWMIDGARPEFSMPLPIAVGVFVALMVLAIAASAVLGARMGRGIRSTPEAAFTGTIFGITWSVGFFALYAFGNALIVNGMDPVLANIYYPTGSALFVGLMYIMAGGIWRAIPAVVMGAWIVLVALIAPYFGYPNHYLFFAIAGGGVFLVGAVIGFVVGFRRMGVVGGKGGRG